MHRYLTALASAGYLVVTVELPVAGQAASPPALVVYGMEEGLSQGSVEALLQDRAGFLWVGTHDGLNRFDGIRFRVYKHQRDDPTTLSDDFVLALAEAPDGKLWVGSERGGLDLFDPLNGTVERMELLELGPWVMDAGPDQNRPTAGRTINEIAPLAGSHLLLRSDVGLVLFDVRLRTSELLPTLGLSATALCAITAGAVVGFEDGSVRVYGSDGAWLDAATVESSVVRLRCEDDQSIRIVTASGRVHHLALSTRSTTPAPFDFTGVASGTLDLKDITSAPDGSTWIATLTGAYMVPNGGTTAHLVAGPPDGGVPDPWVTKLLVDRSGVLWIGTWNGLASLSPLAAAMTRIPNRNGGSEGLEGTGVVALEPHPFGGLWLGSIGGGVQRIDFDVVGAVANLGRAPEFAAWRESVIFDFASGAQGELWVAAHADGVLLRSPSGAVTPVPIHDAVGTPVRATANSVHQDAAGRTWVGTVELGLLRYEPTQRALIPVRGPEWDLGSLYVWPIISAPDGDLWIGAYNGGVARVDPERGVMVRFGSGPAGLSDARVLTLHLDSRGFVWVGTEGGGLNRIDPSTDEVRVYTMQDGLPHDHVEGILEDDLGLLWVSTNDGIAQFDVDKESFRTFGRASGIAGNRFMANAVLRAEGRLHFGGEEGLTIVDPDKILSNPAAPEVALTAFHIQGREESLSRALDPRGLDLAPSERFFAFDFAALDFTDPDRNRYRYRLDPLERDWIDAEPGRTANYTSVPPGAYVFRVAARNAAGVWNEEGIAIPVLVRAPYYATWWFRLGAASGVLSLLAGLYAYRLKEMRRRQELRLAIAGRLHDDIGADLSSIAMKADIMGRQAGVDSSGRTMLAQIARAARDSAHKVRETVWIVSERYDTLPLMVSKMRDLADTMLVGQLPFAFVIVPDPMPDLRIEWELRQDLYFLFKEALSNASKHARATHMRIEFEYLAKKLVVRIADDGVGFDSTVASVGNGLPLMQARATKHGGTLSLESGRGGTTILVELPLA